MKFNIYDMVKIINDNEMLTKRNVFKGYSGVIIDVLSNSYRVMVSNRNNYGESIFVTLNENNMEFLSVSPSEFRVELQAFLLNVDINDDLKVLKICDVKEYDKVEMLVNKDIYTKEGVYKGMKGVVVSDYAIYDKWQVIFSEEDTGRDIAMIAVSRQDFKIID